MKLTKTEGKHRCHRCKQVIEPGEPHYQDVELYRYHSACALREIWKRDTEGSVKPRQGADA